MLNSREQLVAPCRKQMEHKSTLLLWSTVVVVAVVEVAVVLEKAVEHILVVVGVILTVVEAVIDVV